VYTPEPKGTGYPAEICLLAIRLYVEGNSYGSIGRVLKVNPKSVANWVSAYAAQLLKAPLPEKVKKAELDELFAFVGKKKNEIYLLTIMDRDTRCILSWDVVLD
jgi:transposase-like protein